MTPRKYTIIHLVLLCISMTILFLSLYENRKAEQEIKERFPTHEIYENPVPIDNPLNSLPPRPPREEKKKEGDDFVQKAIVLIKKYEGFYANAYKDPKTGNLPITIGWGSTEDESGKPFHMGDKITRERADKLLYNQLKEDYIPRISKIPFWRSMSDGQRAVMVSFGYNLGADFYGGDKFKTITKHLSKKNWDVIPDVLTLYSNPKSKVHNGLLKRRKDEAQKWEQSLVKN